MDLISLILMIWIHGQSLGPSGESRRTFHTTLVPVKLHKARSESKLKTLLLLMWRVSPIRKSSWFERSFSFLLSGLCPANKSDISGWLLQEPNSTKKDWDSRRRGCWRKQTWSRVFPQSWLLGASTFKGGRQQGERAKAATFEEKTSGQRKRHRTNPYRHILPKSLSQAVLQATLAIGGAAAEDVDVHHPETDPDNAAGNSGEVPIYSCRPFQQHEGHEEGRVRWRKEERGRGRENERQFPLQVSKTCATAWCYSESRGGGESRWQGAFASWVISSMLKIKDIAPVWYAGTRDWTCPRCCAPTSRPSWASAPASASLCTRCSTGDLVFQLSS